MHKGRNRPLDFELDRLTSSIENTLTGESLETEIIRLGKDDFVLQHRLKWAFNWADELIEQHRVVHALVTKDNPSLWHGLVSSEDRNVHTSRIEMPESLMNGVYFARLQTAAGGQVQPFAILTK